MRVDLTGEPCSGALSRVLPQNGGAALRLARGSVGEDRTTPGVDCRLPFGGYRAFRVLRVDDVFAKGSRGKPFSASEQSLQGTCGADSGGSAIYCLPSFVMALGSPIACLLVSSRTPVVLAGRYKKIKIKKKQRPTNVRNKKPEEREEGAHHAEGVSRGMVYEVLIYLCVVCDSSVLWLVQLGTVTRDLVELKRVRKQELETKVARADDEVKRATESRAVLQEEQLRDANLALGLLEVKKDEFIACSDALHAGLMDLETSQSIIVLTGEANIKVEASEEAATCAKRVVGNWEVSERVDKTKDLTWVQAQTKSVEEADDQAKRWVITKKEKMKVLWEHVRERGEMLESEQLEHEASQSFPLVDKLKDKTEDRKAMEVQMSNHSKEQLLGLLFGARVCVARYAIKFIHLVVYLELAVMGSG
ncbi:hypothetical protein L7F22_060751 [Adiantum nelumboides]|nr:hypothetical protein [Adiantum nelumboides]